MFRYDLQGKVICRLFPAACGGASSVTGVDEYKIYLQSLVVKTMDLMLLVVGVVRESILQIHLFPLAVVREQFMIGVRVKVMRLMLVCVRLIILLVLDELLLLLRYIMLVTQRSNRLLLHLLYLFFCR